MSRPKFTLARLFIVVAGLAALFAVVRGTLSILETEFWRVHPSEESIADHIRRIGGAYHAVGKDDWHITGVWLQDTATTDQDLERVLELQYLISLDISNTGVTDASLGRIFAHKTIERLRVSGSRISRDALRAEFAKSGERISLDE
jgi:hypothetical protein